MCLAHGSEFFVYSRFVGKPHINAMIRLVGWKHVDVILGELGSSVEMMVRR